MYRYSIPKITNEVDIDKLSTFQLGNLFDKGLKKGKKKKINIYIHYIISYLYIKN